jgi:signal transduction histidine kinase
VDADRRFLELVVSSLSSGLLAIDGDGRVRHANAAARRVLRLPHDATCGRPSREVLASQPELADLLLSALAGGETPGRAELTLRPADAAAPGAVIGFTLAAVRDAAGRQVGAAVVFRDLGLVERLEERGRLRERLAALGEMAAGLAHEIRNPLAGLKVTGELLRRRVGPDPEATELVRELLDEIAAVEETVDAALAFVKPLPLAARAVDLVEVLEDAFARVASRIPFAGSVERRYETPAPRVTGDPEQLRTVFANLLSNACEAMSEQREAGVLVLEVATAPTDRSEPPPSTAAVRVQTAHEACVSVTDTGPGVAPEHRQKIFHPFFTTRDCGSGVGLATAHKIVVAHGGALELFEAPHGGASFRVRLPLEAAP